VTPREILALCREKEVQLVDLRLADLSGAWHHLTIPVARLDEDLFEEGLGFDGSLLWGGPPASASDLLAVPQPDTAYLDPVAAEPTLAILCNFQDPLTREPFARDPRDIAQKAENYLRSTGFAVAVLIGPKAQFLVFDDAQFQSSAAASDCQMSPLTGGAPLFAEIMRALGQCGLEVTSHLQPASPWLPSAIGLAHQPIVEMADAVLNCKHIVRQVARRRNKRATFMPQPLAEGPGSGMHTSLSFWKKDQPLFAGQGYAGLSEMALYSLGGILRHAPALMAICNPTTSSYKRLAALSNGSGQLQFAQQNRAAACRIPAYSPSPKSRRIEIRFPDPSCNPYLAFAALVLAAIDGIQLKLHPGPPFEESRTKGSRGAGAELPPPPATLDEALRALENDHEFLLHDDVFTEDTIQTWIDRKRQTEIQPLRLRPHPFEFSQYFDA
jgi:glutamine synthetase